MELSSFDLGRKKQLTKQMAIIVFGIILFYAAIATPINIWINSDILIAETLFPTVWDFLMELANYAFYWCVFSFLLYTFFRFETKQTTPFFVIAGLAVLLRYPFNQLGVYFVNGFPLLEDFVDSLGYLFLDICFDVLTLTIFSVAMVFVKRRSMDRKYSKKGSFFSDNLPFTSLFSVKNPIQSVLFVGAGWLSLGRIVSRVIYDVFLGPPRSLPDLLWMMLYYSLDVIFLFVSVLICVFLVNRLCLDDARMRMELEATADLDRIVRK